MKAVNTLIRKAYKAALRIPAGTANARLDERGIYNSCEELIDEHLTNQTFHLTKTYTGKHMVKLFRINDPATRAHRETIPLEIRDNLIVKPLPKHMPPAHHQYRRQLRAQYLQKQWSVTMHICLSEILCDNILWKVQPVKQVRSNFALATTVIVSTFFHLALFYYTLRTLEEFKKYRSKLNKD